MTLYIVHHTMHLTSGTICTYTYDTIISIVLRGMWWWDLYVHPGNITYMAALCMTYMVCMLYFPAQCMSCTSLSPFEVLFWCLYLALSYILRHVMSCPSTQYCSLAHNHCSGVVDRRRFVSNVATWLVWGQWPIVATTWSPVRAYSLSYTVDCVLYGARFWSLQLLSPDVKGLTSHPMAASITLQ